MNGSTLHIGFWIWFNIKGKWPMGKITQKEELDLAYIDGFNVGYEKGYGSIGDRIDNV